MEIDGHEETTGEEIDWACDTRKQSPEDDWIDQQNREAWEDSDPFGERQEAFCN